MRPSLELAEMELDVPATVTRITPSSVSIVASTNLPSMKTALLRFLGMREIVDAAIGGASFAAEVVGDLTKVVVVVEVTVEFCDDVTPPMATTVVDVVVVGELVETMEVVVVVEVVEMIVEVVVVAGTDTDTLAGEPVEIFDWVLPAASSTAN